MKDGWCSNNKVNEVNMLLYTKIDFLLSSSANLHLAFSPFLNQNKSHDNIKRCKHKFKVIKYFNKEQKQEGETSKRQQQ
jgi:hypothetical protein